MTPAAPLTGRRALVTRAAAQAEPLATALEQLGASVGCIGLLRFVPLPAPDVAETLRRLSAFDFIILTSPNAAAELARVALASGIDLGRGHGEAAFVAAGPATAAVLEQAGCGPVAVPGEFSAAGIAALLREGIRGRRALLPRAEEAEPWLPDWLRARGVEVVELKLYRTEVEVAAREALHAELARGVDIITFASPSAIRAFRELAPVGWALPAGACVACIGPTTAAAASDAALVPAVVAREHTAAGLARAIGDHFA